LKLEEFFAARLGASREGTEREKVLRMLTIYRLLSPGSEGRLHRHWFAATAVADLLRADAGAAADDTLYRCLDLLLAHSAARAGKERGMRQRKAEGVLGNGWAN